MAQSYKRIISYKNKHTKELRFSDPVPVDLYEEATDIYANANYGRTPLCSNPKFETWAKKAEAYMKNTTSQDSSATDNSSPKESRGVQ